MQAGPRWDVKIADATDEIARRDAVLRPLSLALPGLRILMHTDESGKNKRGAPYQARRRTPCPPATHTALLARVLR